jgi:hypothetical protein
MRSEFYAAKKVLNNSTHIDFGKSFKLAKLCAHGLRNSEYDCLARDLIIRVLDRWVNVAKNTHTLWNDLVETAGLYPYAIKNILSGSSVLRYEYHQSKYLKDVVLHEEQNLISLKLLAGKSVVLSAPTSFGKSLLIDELVASQQYKNIVIIQPTLALLDETRKKLQRYRDQYKLIVSTTQFPSGNIGNIFLFTAERVVEYPHFPTIDYFVIDEFYKLSLNRDDDRAITLNHAFYKLLHRTSRFYLLGPMIKSIPSDFKKRYDVAWHHTTFATVAVDEVDIAESRKMAKEERAEELFTLLLKLPEPTLIYCSSPEKATDLASLFLEYLNLHKIEIQISKDTSITDMEEWLHENIHPDWVLIKCLGKAIGIHHGALPRHLGSSIVDAFNTGGIRYLFCTSTLIEGVNTTAKNVVLFDKRKGMKPIDFFDYRNIAGRSGRMKIHYIGKVFRFHEEPIQMELDVDIPIITQVNAPLELLIQIDPVELSPDSQRKLKGIVGLDEKLLEILKLNSGIPVEGQLSVIAAIEKDLTHYKNVLRWRSFPTYKQLHSVLELAWNHLIRKTESKANVRNPAQLAVYTIKYVNLKSIAALINQTLNDRYWIETVPDLQARVNKVVFNILNMTRHWFDYKLPKLLGAVSNLQKYVLTKHGQPYGDYTYLASTLENGFVSKNLSTLLEFDIPLSAVKKLEPVLPPDAETDTILRALRGINFKKYGLNNYEIKKLRGLV